MKYVNPDSTHPLSSHIPNEDQSQKPSRRPMLRRATGRGQASRVTPAASVIIACTGSAVLGFLAARLFAVRSLTVKNLRVERLDVDQLHIEKHESERASMDDTGGVLRFELGSSDVYETGLE
jgi:hypothetical protein